MGVTHGAEQHGEYRRTAARTAGRRDFRPGRTLFEGEPTDPDARSIRLLATIRRLKAELDRVRGIHDEIPDGHFDPDLRQ